MHFTRTNETNKNNGKFYPKFRHSSIFPEIFLSVSFEKHKKWNGHRSEKVESGSEKGKYGLEKVESGLENDEYEWKRLNPDQKGWIWTIKGRIRI